MPMMHAMNSGSSTWPRRASRRRAASTNTASVSISVPSRSKTTARAGLGAGSRLCWAALIGVDVGELVLPDRLGREFVGALVGGGGLAQQLGEVAGVEVLRTLVRRDRGLAGAEVDPESQTGDRKLVVGEQGRPPDS